MKDNTVGDLGFSLILCGEFHGINVGAYVKKVSTIAHTGWHFQFRLIIDSIRFHSFDSFIREHL